MHVHFTSIVLFCFFFLFLLLHSQSISRLEINESKDFPVSSLLKECVWIDIVSDIFPNI